MDVLLPFLNHDALTRQISTSISEILISSNDLSRQENQIKALSQIFQALPSSIQLQPIPSAEKLFDHLLEKNPTADHHCLLSFSFKLMINDDRLQRIQIILRKILDQEYSVSSREILCKILSHVETFSSSSTLNIDWQSIESSFSIQQDPKFVTYACRFLSKTHPADLEQMFLRLLTNGKYQDESLLSCLVEFNFNKSIPILLSFWNLIQRSLIDATSKNDRIRKCAVYLLRRILTDQQFQSMEIIDENLQRFVFVSNEKFKQFWIDYLIVYEGLEDGVVHLIRPLLTKFDRLLIFSLDEKFSLNWIFILLQRLFVGTSSPLARWAVKWFFNSMKFPDRQAETFFIETLFDWTSYNFVFLKGEEIQDPTAMELCFESFIERWIKSSQTSSLHLQSLLSRFSTIKWSHLSLTRVLYCLRSFALANRDQALLHDEHIKLLSTLTLTQFQTFAPVLRLSAYSSILEFVIHLVDWSISSTSDHLLRFFSIFDRSTFLGKHFSTICKHFTLNVRQLQLFIEDYLNSDSTIVSSEMRIFSTENHLCQSRQIAFLLDLVDTHSTEIFKTLFNPLLENIRTAYQRPYTSIEHVRRSIELCYVLIQETYFHSSHYLKDWLASSLRLIVREAFNFIKLHATKQPMFFLKLPIVFLMVGNHGDISRYLQDLCTQIDSFAQAKNIDGCQSMLMLFGHSIDWLLKNRATDFHSEWDSKLRLLPVFNKTVPFMDENSKTVSQADLLIAKYILVTHQIKFDGSNDILTEDFFKASQRELPYLFSALAQLLKQNQISHDEKSKWIETSLSVMQELDHRMPAYWHCLTTFCQAVSPWITDVTLCHLLTPWFEKMLDQSRQISGIVNVFLEYSIPIWLKEHRIQTSHLPIVVSSILFGHIYQKDKKQQWQAEQLIEQDESDRALISQTHTTPEYRYDRNVRLLTQLFLLHIWPSLVRVQQDEIVKDIIERHSRLAFQERRPRFCTNSLEHRLMLRSLQCLLCLTSVIKDSSLLKTIYDHVVETLISENEPSLRLLAEWIIVRLVFEDRTTRLNDLFDCLRNAHRYRIGTICAWISISAHLLHFLCEPGEQVDYINRVIEHLSPLFVHSNFHIRTFSCSTMIKFLEFIERNHLEKQTPYQSYRWFKENDEKSELGRYTSKLHNLFLYQFEPIRDFSLETIFYILPKLSLITDEEFLLPEWFIESSQQFHLAPSIPVHNLSTILQSCQPGIWRLTAAGKLETLINHDDENSSTFQHKANPYPVIEPSDDAEVRTTIQRTQLIVVASLIDKQANLGGLCRTSEIFGVKEFVLGSLRILEDQQFLSLSMTAQKWLKIRQVQEKELKDYLIDCQAQGYTIIAVEQTVNSQNLFQYEFPEKTLLLLGNEREGIRADLLSLVDATVEIPQAGVIRSLNVHVSGALCISEYARKYLNLKK